MTNKYHDNNIDEADIYNTFIDNVISTIKEGSAPHYPATVCVVVTQDNGVKISTHTLKENERFQKQGMVASDENVSEFIKTIIQEKKVDPDNIMVIVGLFRGITMKGQEMRGIGIFCTKKIGDITASYVITKKSVENGNLYFDKLIQTSGGQRSIWPFK